MVCQGLDGKTGANNPKTALFDGQTVLSVLADPRHRLVQFEQERCALQGLVVLLADGW